MIDLKNGRIIIAEDLHICPTYTFDEFKKSKYYVKQDGIRVIYLDGNQYICGRKYIVSLFFRNQKLYMLSLICCDNEYNAMEEQKRKNLHDEILKELGIINEKSFLWGKISSIYDARSNCSSINITYY